MTRRIQSGFINFANRAFCHDTCLGQFIQPGHWLFYTCDVRIDDGYFSIKLNRKITLFSMFLSIQRLLSMKLLSVEIASAGLRRFQL